MRKQTKSEWWAKLGFFFPSCVVAVAPGTRLGPQDASRKTKLLEQLDKQRGHKDKELARESYHSYQWQLSEGERVQPCDVTICPGSKKGRATAIGIKLAKISLAATVASSS